MPTIIPVELVLSCADLSRVSLPWPNFRGAGLQGTPCFAPDSLSKRDELHINICSLGSIVCTGCL